MIDWVGAAMAYPRALPAAPNMSSASRHDDFPAGTTVFRSHRLLQDGGVDRKLSQALASCSKDRVGHCWHDGGSPGLAHSARRLRTLDDVNLDGRRLIHAQHLVGVEIGLLD